MTLLINAIDAHWTHCLFASVASTVFFACLHCQCNALAHCKVQDEEVTQVRWMGIGDCMIFEKCISKKYQIKALGKLMTGYGDIYWKAIQPFVSLLFQIVR